MFYFPYFYNTMRLGINLTNLSTGRYACGNYPVLEEVIHPVLQLVDVDFFVLFLL